MGACSYDEFNQPNYAFAALLGIKDRKLEDRKADAIRFEKQYLPFAKSLVGAPGATRHTRG